MPMTASPVANLGARSRDRSTTSSRRNFCPLAGLMPGASTQWTRQTAALLRGRLRAVALIVVVAVSMFLARRLFFASEAPIPWPLQLGSLAIAGGIFALLASSRPVALPKLRIIEGVMFLGFPVMFLQIDFLLISRAITDGGPDVGISQWNLSVMHFVLWIVAYALFVPNTWQRALPVILPLALVPVSEGAWFVSRYPELLQAAALSPELGLQQGSVSLLMLAISVLIAAYGIHTINEYRVAAAEAGQMGQYHLRHLIGRGGMGEVWLGEHRLLARPAAIKLIRSEVLAKHGGYDGVQQQDLVVKRFEREAQATASLTSPHTIDLYDFGISEDGTFHYVMEYLDGYNLRRLVETHGPMQPERAVYLLLQVCASLADAHANGLIHRDIKPANLFTCQMGLSHDFVKVLDFGLVKQIGNGSQATQLTVQGETSGTPAFMSPEVALGEHEVDERTDIYSLGCVAYWLITGQKVFEHDSPMATVVDHVKTTPEPPSTRTELTIPDELDAIILRCLEKEPGKRFQSAVDLADELRTVPLTGVWDERSATDWWRLHPPNIDAE